MMRTSDASFRQIASVKTLALWLHPTHSRNALYARELPRLAHHSLRQLTRLSRFLAMCLSLGAALAHICLAVLGPRSRVVQHRSMPLHITR